MNVAFGRAIRHSFSFFFLTAGDVACVRPLAPFRASRLLSALMLVLTSVFALSQTPTLTSISPTALSPGMQATLTGSGFGASQGGGGVYFVGTGVYGTIVSWNSTQVVFTVPSGIRPGNVLVFQNGVNSNSIAYTFIPPVLSSISPTAVVPGMQMTLTGSGFGAAQDNGSVYFGYGAYGTVVSWSSTQVVVTVPTGISPGNVLVNQNGVNGNSLSYTIIPRCPARALQVYHLPRGQWALEPVS